MKTVKKISAVGAIGLGILFLAVGGTDIQYGFGLVLITQGIANL